MVTLEKKRNKYIVTQYTYPSVKGRPTLLFEITLNNGLDAVQHLTKEGILEEFISPAYRAIFYRGFTKAYFTREGTLLYLKK